MFKKYSLLILLSILLVNCNKEDSPPVSLIPPDIPGTEFIIPVTKDIIMYEVNIRAFGPGSDFVAVLDRLDEIKKLNVNVIWLMPIHPIGEVNSVNSPYSVKNYKEVSPEFGSLTGFKELVDEAHKRDIAIVIDWVANHSAWDNPWINNAEWYTQDGSGNIIHPPGTNWQDVADLNYENQEMRLAMIDAMKFWIEETAIDGFRCDAADMVPYDFWQQAIDSLHEIPEKSLILLAEGARKDHFTAGFQLNYSWDFYNKLKDVFISGQPANILFSIHQSEYAGIPEGAHRLRFTTNHDESAWDATPMVLFNGIDGALAASVITVFLGGTPLVYGSQEVGTIDNVPFFSSSSLNWSQNPQMLERYQQLFDFYNSSDAAKSSPLEFYPHSKVVAFSKSLNDTELLILVNTSNNEVSFPLPESLQNTDWTNVLDQSGILLLNTVELQPYEYSLLER